MRITHVKLRIRPEKAELYEATFDELRSTVLEEEPGCTFFELCKDPEDALTYHVIEAYEDDKAVEEHVSTPYYKTTARIFVECLQGEHMTEIERRGLEGRDMYSVVEGMDFERFETV